jgi:hypothetical protein
VERGTGKKGERGEGVNEEKGAKVGNNKRAYNTNLIPVNRTKTYFVCFLGK